MNQNNFSQSEENISNKKHIEVNQILYIILYILISFALYAYIDLNYIESINSIIFFIIYFIFSIFILLKIKYIRCILYPLTSYIYGKLIFFTIALIIDYFLGSAPENGWLMIFPHTLILMLLCNVIPISFIYGLIQDIKYIKEE